MDLESIVSGIVATATRKMIKARQEFEPIDPTSNDMLQWEDYKHKFAEIQQLEGGFARVGTVGDGNCLLHSLLFATSPTYREYNKAARSYIADHVRNVVVARADEIRDMADVAFVKIGGSGALEESFDILEGKREEINIELAPLVGRLFGVNLLAVQIRAGMRMHPVCATYLGRDPAMPTVLVNYLGGGLDFGNAAEGFQEGGHYECIFAPHLVAGGVAAAAAGGEGAGGGAAAGAGSRRGRTSAAAAAAAAARVVIDEAATRYIFNDEHIAPLLAMFAAACPTSENARAEEAAAVAAAAAAAPVVAIATAAAARTPSGNRTRKRTSSSGRKTRKRTSSGSKKKSTSSH
jgi:hypothetical protein